MEHETGGVFGAGGGNFGRARTGKIASARVGLLWLKMFNAKLAAKWFEQRHARKVVVIIEVYVDDLQVASETKRGEERLVMRSGAGAVFTPHRIQCGMLNLEEGMLY